MSQEDTAGEGHAHSDLDLDIIDLKLLGLLCNTRLWKKQIHDRFNEDPPIDPRSLQTIARRIDTLHEHALIESTVVKGEPDDLRELYIAFETTGKGQTVLRHYLGCTEEDCAAITTQADHVHTFVPAEELFVE